MKIRILLFLVALSGIAQAQTAPAAPSVASGTASEPAPFFRDVPRDHWAFAAVQRLAGAGILEGYPTTTGAPQPVAASPAPRAVKVPIQRGGLVMTTVKTKAALGANVALRGTFINVATNVSAQTLTLSGTTKSEAQKQLASAIARKSAPGVAIVNQKQLASAIARKSAPGVAIVNQLRVAR